MKKITYLFSILLAGQQLAAQLPEDAIRMSWNPITGTARNQALGGAAGSLGADISSVFVNPAGIGFYKTGEFVLSPSLNLYSGDGTFRGTNSNSASFNKFNLGTSGFVWGYHNPYSKNKNKAFSIAINRTANFNGRTYYSGNNNYSSFSESFAEEFASSGEPINTVLYAAPLSFGTKLANYTFLIDTLTVNGGVEVVGLPQRNAILNGTDAELRQTNDIRTKGGITEIALAYAVNMKEKVFIGGSLGIPIVNYERNTIFREEDISGDNDNNFNYASYREDYSVKGVGLNARLGIIVKPEDTYRLGLSIHTPTLYGLREQTTGRMEADLENYLDDGQISVATADSIYTQFGADIPVYRYDMVSPWKFVLSGTVLFSAVEDVTKQKGFITADVEYVTHGSSRFNSAEQGDNNAYYDGVNEGIKYAYKGALNFRVGGEMKFNTFMTRLGFAYYGKPYQESQFKASRMNVSGGLGYRNSGIFVDLTYVYGIYKDVNFPYRLADKANTYAEINNNSSNILLTLGVKF